MTGVYAGIGVTTSVEVTDYAALGRFIAETDADDQANFFRGMSDGFVQPWGIRQLAAIKGEVAKLSHDDQKVVGRFAHYFHEYMGAGS